MSANKFTDEKVLNNLIESLKTVKFIAMADKLRYEFEYDSQKYGDYIESEKLKVEDFCIDTLNLLVNQLGGLLEALAKNDLSKVKEISKNKQQAEVEDLNRDIDTLYRAKESLKKTLKDTETKYQAEITRLDALLVCKNKTIRNLEKSFELVYDGAIKEFTARLNEIPTNAVEKYKINSIAKEMIDK